jgi:hypothetical protein
MQLSAISHQLCYCHIKNSSIPAGYASFTTIKLKADS